MNFSDQLQTISLEELNEAAALQTRTDRKYILTQQQAEQVLPLLAQQALVLSIDGRRASDYTSVYFDTPDLASFHLAAHPRRRRFKVRTRSYMDTQQCYLEVKTEGAREQTVKERIEHPFADRAALSEQSLEYIQETLDHELGSCPIVPTSLTPVIDSSYSRTTLFLPETNSRVTVDNNLVWTEPRTGFRLECNEIIVETKSALNAGPADKLLWRHQIRPSRISKFATGMSLLNQNLPANRWHKTTKHKISTAVSLHP
ncbi:polyphosphate polymerase domain-containing protein [Glutamicibacter ectropisis]|uniref:Polyphosphate polymerase domain-containing protein n=1 Tax=Glutamicibacter ectropisis TaxID=3046593 RepID=A0AAU6WH73_9MICC